MAVSIEGSILDCASSFQKTYVKTELACSCTETAAECKTLYGPLRVTFVADVSGSMMPNMTILKNSLLALIDLAGEGSCVRVLTFDDVTRTILKSTILSKDNIPEIKESIKTTLVNYGKSTNLQEAIRYCLSETTLIETPSQLHLTQLTSSTSSSSFIDPRQPLSSQATSAQAAQGGSDPKHSCGDVVQDKQEEETGKDDTEQITIFASDGLANSGLITSPYLLTFARTFETYFNQTFYTLGIKLDPYTELNSELLKDMALDSGGSFAITSNSDGIAEILGDVLAHHYFVRFTDMQFKCESKNGHSGSLCTKIPKRGGVLRADKPLELIWEFPCEALPPFTLHVSMKKRQIIENKHLKETNSSENVLDLKPFVEDDIEKIFGCVLLAPAMDRKQSLEELKEKIVQFEKFMNVHLPAFKGTLHYVHDSLKNCLEKFGYGGEQTAEDSMHSYAMSSGGGAVMSVQAAELRSSALQATQAQSRDESWDSQKTVESESNKRQKTSQ